MNRNSLEIGQLIKPRIFLLFANIIALLKHFRIYLFDIRMFTKLTTASTAYALTAGQRVKGTASGAKGTVAVSSASGATTVWLMDVEGTFSTSDTIRLEFATATGKGVTAVKSYSTDGVRALFQEWKITRLENYKIEEIGLINTYEKNS